MSQPEIKRLQQILARLAKKRAAHEKRLRELGGQPRDGATRAKLKILRLELQRLEREIHMHQRQLERLREQTDGV
jgi:hypothetical protein